MGTGVPSSDPGRTRKALAGLKSHKSAALTCALTCRSGLASSKIQNDRPCVATTKSSSCITKSRIEVVGILSCNDCQESPSSSETYTPFSVHAYSKPLRDGSSRTQFRKLPSEIPRETCCQLFPKSRVRYR